MYERDVEGEKKDEEWEKMLTLFSIHVSRLLLTVTPLLSSLCLTSSLNSTSPLALDVLFPPLFFFSNSPTLLHTYSPLTAALALSPLSCSLSL